MTRSGYVLVGGRSSRMGRDKALLYFQGEPLARRIGAEVERACGSTTLVGEPARYGGLGYPVIADAFPGEGPLGGIITALRHTAAEWSLIVACDMPELSAEFLERLLKAAEKSGRTTVPRGPDGRLEPLCAVWRREALAAAEATFAGGIRKVSVALERAGADAYAVTEVSLFQNVNTPEDWIRHAAE